MVGQLCIMIGFYTIEAASLAIIYSPLILESLGNTLLVDVWMVVHIFFDTSVHLEMLG